MRSSSWKNRTQSKSSRSLAATLGAALVALTLNACVGTPTTPTTGKLRFVDGGTQLEVPALWADPNTGEGGIEPASVWVDPTRADPDLAYEVNLTDVQAKGGGAQWQAATSSAAALATLVSGQNPNQVAYKFAISGPIDGPSAGALLTVGALAALQQHELTPGVTMTGTISPDGSIGPVGLVEPKLRAAAAAGYTTVVLPAMATEVVDPDTDTTVDTESYASALGLEVKYVRSIGEAYIAFTGQTIITDTPTTQFAFADFAELNATRTEVAKALQADVAERLSQLSDAPPIVSEQLSLSEQASEAGDVTTAFALAVDALQLLETWRGQRDFQQLERASGVGVAREQLLQQVRSQLAAVSHQIDEAAAHPKLTDPSRSLALPGALSWLTYGQAILTSLELALQNDSLDAQPEVLASYAGLAAEVSAEAQTVFPLTVVVLLAVPETPLPDAAPSQTFQTGYNNFLIEAGDANLNYLREVHRIQDSKSRVTDLLPVVTELAAEAEAIQPQADTLAQEIKDSAVAMSYYVTTMSLVTSVQGFGSADLWLSREEKSVGNLSYLTESINESLTLTRLKADLLLEDDFNAGYPLWSAEWGAAAFRELTAKDRNAAGASLALNELWFDSITVLMMSAYVNDH